MGNRFLKKGERKMTYNKEYYKKNREKLLEYQKKWQSERAKKNKRPNRKIALKAWRTRRKQGKEREWNKREENFIKKNYQSKTQKELARILDRSVSSINHKARRLNLKKG
jgi:hypothetical protein